MGGTIQAGVTVVDVLVGLASRDEEGTDADVVGVRDVLVRTAGVEGH